MILKIHKCYFNGETNKQTNKQTNNLSNSTGESALHFILSKAFLNEAKLALCGTSG